MIVKMKKIHIIVHQKDVNEALNEIRDVGVMHVEHQDDLKSREIFNLRDDVDIYSRVLNVLKSQKNPGHQVESGDLEARASLILERLGRIDELKEIIASREKQIEFWSPWGEFEPEDFNSLKSNNIFMRLCEIPKKKEASFPEEILCEVLSETKKIKRCLLISRTPISVPIETLPLPQTSLDKMKALVKEEKEELFILEQKLRENVRYSEHVQKELDALFDQLHFQEAVAGLKKDDDISVLKGFVPVDQADDLGQKAKAKQWGLLLEDPTDEDEVPTLLKNPKWVELTKPVLNMVEVQPGYKEVDISPVFMIFFTLFFGMLIGDAAYGTIFFLAVILLHIKLKNKIENPTPFYLGYLVTGFTILWGVLTGTYFGQIWVQPQVPALVPWLNDAHNLQWLCFTIALVHLNIARFWAVCVKFPDLGFLEEVGWMLVIVAMYFLANMFVLGEALPSYFMWLIGIGASMTFIFRVPFKQFAKRMPQEFIPWFLGVIGAGTDIMSYIRLFAVGLATIAVADAANTLPEALGPVLGTFFLLFLHALNMVLALMAILVHDIRLNMLEFSGHLGMEWVGVKFNPFRKRLKV